MGKDGSELKYQFQKFPNTVHLHLFSSERAWRMWAHTGDSQSSTQGRHVNNGVVSAGSPLPTNR